MIQAKLQKKLQVGLQIVQSYRTVRLFQTIQYYSELYSIGL